MTDPRLHSALSETPASRSDLATQPSRDAVEVERPPDAVPRTGGRAGGLRTLHI